MTRVLVYEFCCALGLGREPSDPAHSLYREGRAMRDAVTADLKRVAGVTVRTPPDEDAPIPDDHLRELLQQTDWALIIAPESEQILEQKVRLAEQIGTRLLGPSVEGVRLTSDKLALAERWTVAGVPTPPTRALAAWPAQHFPAVWKPRDGAGSTATFRIDSPDARDRVRAVLAAEGFLGELIAQDWVPGQPASVAFLVGPGEVVPLQPTIQQLSSDGRFHYLGGELPLRPDLAERAIRLGRRAIDCVPGLRGYVGVDLILGGAADGSEDFAIEINPRLTTSYVGLQRLAEFNLGEAMLRVTGGVPGVRIAWKPGRVRFDSRGNTEYDPVAGAVVG